MKVTAHMIRVAWAELERQGVALDEMSPELFVKPLFEAMYAAQPCLERSKQIQKANPQAKVDSGAADG